MTDIQLRKLMLKNEKNYYKLAAKDKNATRFNTINDDFRSNYFRDIDRIIHSLSYTRYIDKTQVFSSCQNDNVSKRIIHVQLVSKIARTIGRALSLNEDLIEAIALGHDIGHTPFGHEGEYILNDISIKNNEGYFNHNAQSVRTLMVLENNGEGKNLTVQTLDGILCHNGEFLNDQYHPKNKTINDFISDYENTYKIENYSKNLIPMTLEGCVVRISDMIGYLGRDIEDAVSMGIISKESIPDSITKILGHDNKKIVNTIIVDIIKNSYHKPYIKISKNIYQAMKDLKKYNSINIYAKANTKEALNYYKKAFNELFTYYQDHINDQDCSINRLYLANMNKEYLNNNSINRKIIDYIAGMTDDFLINEYEKIVKK